MSSPEPVDFVVDSDEIAADPADEELAQPHVRPLRASRALWASGGAVVVAGALVAVARHGTTSPSAAPSPAPSVVVGSPAVVGATASVRVPEGNRSAQPRPDCPPGAQCYSDTTVPTPTLTALRRDFPSAQLTSATSVLADRLGRFGPDLVSRLVHARAGSVDITLTVHKPQRGDTGAYTHDRTGQLLHSLDTYAGTGFTVSVEIVQLGPKHRPSRAALDRIVRDSRLVVPQ